MAAGPSPGLRARPSRKRESEIIGDQHSQPINRTSRGRVKRYYAKRLRRSGVQRLSSLVRLRHGSLFGGLLFGEPSLSLSAFGVLTADEPNPGGAASGQDHNQHKHG